MNMIIHDFVVVNIIILNPFKLEFTIVIFIHYKPRIAVAIVVDEDDFMWFEN